MNFQFNLTCFCFRQKSNLIPHHIMWKQFRKTGACLCFWCWFYYFSDNFMFSLEFFHSFFHADSTKKLLQFLMFFVISHFFFQFFSLFFPPFKIVQQNSDTMFAQSPVLLMCRTITIIFHNFRHFFIYRNADTIHIFSASVYDSCNFMQLISENILHFLYLKSMHFLFFIDLFSTVIWYGIRLLFDVRLCNHAGKILSVLSFPIIHNSYFTDSGFDPIRVKISTVVNGNPTLYDQRNQF